MSISCDHTTAEARSASAPPGSVDSKTRLVNAIRVLQGERLRDESAHRRSEYAWSPEDKRLDYSRSIIGELGDIKWPSVIRGAADPTVVEEDELVGRCEAVDERRIPVGARRGEAIQEQERSAIPNSTTNDSRAINLDRGTRFTVHRRLEGKSPGERESQQRGEKLCH